MDINELIEFLVSWLIYTEFQIPRTWKTETDFALILLDVDMNFGYVFI